MTFEEHLKSYLDDQEIKNLLNSLRDKDYHCALLNPRKMSDETFISLFPNVKKHPIVNHCYIYDKEEYELGKSVYHELGCFYLQEPSAAVPSFLLNPNKNDFVLDLCSAPGGKTIQASFLMENEGCIISNDLSRQRCFATLENIERLGIANTILVNCDFSHIYSKYLNTFDKIILDAPCSGSGMFRKNKLMEDDWSYQKVIKCQEIQKSLILYAYQMLKPGGQLVYSTCSFSQEEDEDVVSYLLKETDAEIINQDPNPLYYINRNKSYGFHLLPSFFPGEGQYICLIKKPGILEQKKDTINLDKTYNKYFDSDIPNLKIDKYGDFLFGNTRAINIKDLNVIRKGVKIGEISHDFLKYDFHYARYLKTFSNELNISLDMLTKYLRGETLTINSPKGYILLKYQEIPIDLAKSDTKVIKNKYPKGLRKNF